MVETDKLRFKLGDYIILIIVCSLLILVNLLLMKQEEGNSVYVTVNGITTTYSLCDKQKIPVMNMNGTNPSMGEQMIINTIVIENGEVFMENATCPDQVCVNHKAISKNGEMIICLPNQVFVEVVSNEDSGIDN